MHTYVLEPPIDELPSDAAKLLWDIELIRHPYDLLILPVEQLRQLLQCDEYTAGVLQDRCAMYSGALLPLLPLH
jgi:hypothetical protein